MEQKIRVSENVYHECLRWNIRRCVRSSTSATGEVPVECRRRDLKLGGHILDMDDGR
jgi:hypothetical protein